MRSVLFVIFHVEGNLPAVCDGDGVVTVDPVGAVGKEAPEAEAERTELKLADADAGVADVPGTIVAGVVVLVPVVGAAGAEGATVEDSEEADGTELTEELMDGTEVVADSTVPTIGDLEAPVLTVVRMVRVAMVVGIIMVVVRIEAPQSEPETVTVEVTVVGLASVSNIISCSLFCRRLKITYDDLRGRYRRGRCRWCHQTRDLRVI